MKKLPILILILLIGTLTAFIDDGNKPHPIEIGTEAPMIDYKMTDISGEEVTLGNMKQDNGMLVIFSCNTCPFVIKWEDRYPKLAELCGKNNIGMVAVNSNEAKREDDDSLEEMQKHAKEKGYKFFYAVDNQSELAKGFGATKTPQIFLFDKNMKLAYTGAIDDNLKDATKVEKHYLSDAIAKMVAGKKIDPNTTKAIGCSIKKVKVDKQK